MRKISANSILPVSSPPLLNGIITVDKDGRILDLQDTGGMLREEPGLEYYNGFIVPGFVIPWVRLDEVSGIRVLDHDLHKNGIKGIGLVLNESMASDGGFQLMAKSSTFYHPVIELCPESGEEEFEVFNRGINLISHAWNEFNLSCSLTICSQALNPGDLGKYLDEYSSSHKNMVPPPDPGSHIHGPAEHLIVSFPSSSLNIMNIIQLSHPRKDIKEVLPWYTLDAAAAIFEGNELGSIEPGKNAGLNLITGLDPETSRITDKTCVKVLV